MKRALTRTLPALFRALPAAWLGGLATALAWVWWLVVPVRRRVAVDNLRRALPEVPVRGVLVTCLRERILDQFELLRWLGHARVHAPTDVQVGADTLPPPGALVVSAHLGAWDLGLATLARRRSTAAYLREPTASWARRLLRESRGPLRPMDARKGLAPAREALDHGECVVFVIDQHVGSGVALPFLGRPARSSTGAARLSLQSGAPVWTARVVREGALQHRIVAAPLALPPPTGDETQDVAARTLAMNAWVEAEIRRRPGDWLWLHRRWKGA